MKEQYPLHSFKCVRCCVGFYLCSTGMKRKYCASTGAEGDIWCEERGSSGGMIKIVQ